MWFDVKAALAKIEADPPANLANPANRVGGLAEIAGLAAPPNMKSVPHAPCPVWQDKHAQRIAEAFNAYGCMGPYDPEAWK